MPERIPISTFLCTDRREPSGETFGSHGVVFLSESLLSEAPERVAEAVAVHEATHLLIGRELRTSVEERHPAIYELLHERVIRDWRSGRVEFRCDRDYVTDKGWRMLYDGWVGPLGVDHQKAVQTIATYFKALSLGHVSLDRDGVFAPPARALAGMPPVWHGTLADEYEKSPDEVAFLAATGFELIDFFRDCLESAASDRSRIQVWLLEEGFANYVATVLTGVTLDEIQRWAPQDGAKIELARRLERSGVTVEDVLRNTMSVQALAAYAKGLGVFGSIPT
jgi:hypothetical protein